MQAVGRLFPDHRLRAIDDRRLDLLAPVRGQTVHEHGILDSHGHHVRIDAPVGKGLLPLGVFGLKAHRGPHIGGDQVGPATGGHRVSERLEMIRSEQACTLRFYLVARRGRDMDIEVEDLGGLQPGIAHIVRVADPRHGLALNGAALLDKGVDVGEDLAGVILVGQAVDDRDPRMGGKTLDDVLLEGANHHDIHHARDHLGRVLDRFAAPQLGIAGIEIDRRTTQLVHTGLKGQAGAGGALLKDHRQGAIGERMIGFVALETLLDHTSAIEQVIQFGAG